MPRLDRPYTAMDRLLALSSLQQTGALGLVQLLEIGRRGFDDGTLARRSMLKTANMHLKRQVPDEAMRQKLSPPYPLMQTHLLE